MACGFIDTVLRTIGGERIEIGDLAEQDSRMD
jgi:hypothetical protein